MRSSNRGKKPANGATWTIPTGGSGLTVIGSMLPPLARRSKNSRECELCEKVLRMRAVPSGAGLALLPSSHEPAALPAMNLLLALAIAGAAPLDTASFAGGCFWSMERAFDQVDGVVSVTVGYTGGHTPHPTYEQVSTELTGHLEAVQVVYDPGKITYKRL